jgi:hypothetical protein
MRLSLSLTNRKSLFSNKTTSPGFRNGGWLSNVAVGAVWQASQQLVPVFLIVLRWTSTWVAPVLAIITTFVLKKNWYDKLEDA